MRIHNCRHETYSCPHTCTLCCSSVLPDSCTCASMLADPYLVSDWLSLWRQAYCKAVCVRMAVETFSLKVWGDQSQRRWLAVNESHSISSSLTHCPSYFPLPPRLALFTWTWLIDRLSFCTPFVPPTPPRRGALLPFQMLKNVTWGRESAN